MFTSPSRMTDLGFRKKTRSICLPSFTGPAMPAMPGLMAQDWDCSWPKKWWTPRGGTSFSKVRKAKEACSDSALTRKNLGYKKTLKAQDSSQCKKLYSHK